MNSGVNFVKSSGPCPRKIGKKPAKPFVYISLPFPQSQLLTQFWRIYPLKEKLI
jgi:hypothetical protein